MLQNMWKQKGSKFFFLWTILMCNWTSLFSQDLKFRFINLKTNEVVENLEIIPLFDLDSYVAKPLIYNREGKYYYYYNDSHDIASAQKIVFYIPSNEFQFPNSFIGTQRYLYKLSSCNNGVCDIGISPTVKLTIRKKNRSDIDFNFSVNHSCHDIGKILAITDKILYQDAICRPVTDSSSIFLFKMVNKEHVLYYTIEEKIVLRVSFLSKGTIINSTIDLPSDIRKVDLVVTRNGVRIHSKK